MLVKPQVTSFMRRCKRVLLGLVVMIYAVVIIEHFSIKDPMIRITMPDWGYPAPSSDHVEKTCHVNINKLGAVTVDMSPPNLTQIEEANQQLDIGGSWSPAGCWPRQSVAILIPYRDRWVHLQILLRRLHPMLRRQNTSYTVFVVEQAGNDSYNKGILYNVGVKQSLKLQPFDCFIFHDVDLIPENDKNLYYCNDHLRHFSAAIDEWRYGLLYMENAGGVVSLSETNIKLINGFSNRYWGWGAEDDDFSRRSMKTGLLLTRPPQHIGRYKMIRHVKRKRAKDAVGKLQTWSTRWKTDGLTSLDTTNYKILRLEKRPLYTWLLVDVGSPPEGPRLQLQESQNQSHWISEAAAQ